MYRAPIHRLLVLTTLVVALEACGPRAPSASSSPWSGALEQIRSAVVAAGGYSPERVEVTASPTLLRIAIGDASLAQADQLARENAAGAIVSAAETVLPQQEVFRSIQVISVAIMHPGTAAETHTEDVLEFRKGPSKRFAHHIT
jgi:hypothetical protein